MARTPTPPPADTDAPAVELDRLERRAQTDAAALQDLRDNLHNATVAATQASGDQLHPALTRKRELERQMDDLLAESAPIVERIKVLRPIVAAERRATVVAPLQTTGAQFAATAPACEAAFTEAFTTLRRLLDAARAVNETARGCGADTLRDITEGLQLSRLKSWLLTQINEAGLGNVPAAMMTYDPHQITPGVAPTAIADDLTLRLETTR